MRNLTVLMLCCTLVGCANLFSRSDEAALAKNASERQVLENAEKALSSGNASASYGQFREFQQTFPQSSYLQSARLGEAKSLAALSRWSESIAVLQDVYLKTVKYQPEIASLAMYQLSFSYEAVGDDLKTVTSLLDAQKLGKYLAPEVVYAEIPARLSMLYGKFGRSKESLSYLNDAEKGLKKVIEIKANDLNKGWLAKTYFQMGSVSTNQLSIENFSQVVKGQKLVQVYLLRSIQLNDPVWSKKALDGLKEVYRDLNGIVVAPPSADSLIAGDDIRSLRQRQILLGGEFIELIDQAELYKPLSEPEMNSLQKDFFSYLASLRIQTERILYQYQETMTLTEESERLNSIRRVVPGEEKAPLALPPKVVPSEDPNL